MAQLYEVLQQCQQSHNLLLASSSLGYLMCFLVSILIQVIINALRLRHASVPALKQLASQNPDF